MFWRITQYSIHPPLPRLIGHPPLTVDHFGFEVVFGVIHGVAVGAVADFEVAQRGGATVDQLVGGAAGFEATAIASFDAVLLVAQAQGGCAFEDVDELVLAVVVVEQGGDGAGGQFGEVDAEVGEAEMVAQLALAPPLHQSRQRWRIGAARQQRADLVGGQRWWCICGHRPSVACLSGATRAPNAQKISNLCKVEAPPSQTSKTSTKPTRPTIRHGQPLVSVASAKNE